jgi:adenine phosphoribosyltransferase
MDYSEIIRDVPDWPSKGIIFKDLTTVWKDNQAFKKSIDEIYERYKDKKIDKVIGAESRGFIYGAVLAYMLGAGFVPVRKPGKLPWKHIEETYELEYGTDSLAMHEDAIEKGEKVLLIDDLIATGGTAEAIVKMVEKLGGEIVEACFFVELTFLNGKEKLKDIPIFSIVKV